MFLNMTKTQIFLRKQTLSYSTRSVSPSKLISIVFDFSRRRKCFFFQAQKMADAGIPVPNSWRRISYFHCSLLGYFLGLLTATVSSEVSFHFLASAASQPRASISRLTFDIRQTSLFLAPVYVKWIFSCLVPRPLIKNLTLFSIWINQVFKAAQPALLYLVPFTLLPLFVMAYLKGDLKTMWHEPFAPPPASATTSKYQDIWRQPTI